MKKKESTDLEVKVVDCSKLEERDLNKFWGKSLKRHMDLQKMAVPRCRNHLFLSFETS